MTVGVHKLSVINDTDILMHPRRMSAIGYGANVNNQNPTPLPKNREVYTVKKIALLIIAL